MKRILWFLVGVVIGVGIGLGEMSVFAQAPPRPAPPGPAAQAPPPCEQQVNEEVFKAGALMQQLAIAREQVRVLTKDRDDAKAALAKTTPKPEEKK
jgi:hypothetical protein